MQILGFHCWLRKHIFWSWCQKPAFQVTVVQPSPWPYILPISLWCGTWWPSVCYFPWSQSLGEIYFNDSASHLGLYEEIPVVRVDQAGRKNWGRILEFDLEGVGPGRWSTEPSKRKQAERKRESLASGGNGECEVHHLTSLEPSSPSFLCFQMKGSVFWNGIFDFCCRPQCSWNRPNSFVTLGTFHSRSTRLGHGTAASPLPPTHDWSV